MSKKNHFLLTCFKEDEIEAGCDEAGRGCLAGPVVAAAVILPKKFQHPYLNDSKQLTLKQRETLRTTIEEQAVAWAVAMVDNDEIDEINILNASIVAMHRAVEQLKVTPTLLLIDGNRFHPYKKIPHHCMIKGDARFMSIAAASVLAKTYRDTWMEEAHQMHPAYRWNKNKGYPTREHREAIALNGITPLHRKSFKLIDQQYKMDL